MKRRATLIAAAVVVLLISGRLRLPDTTTPPALDGPAMGSAVAALRSLPVKGRAPMTGYNRDQFGQAWTDAVPVGGGHNGCDTRSDLLRRSLTHVTIKSNTDGCVPLAGSLNDPYTGHIIVFQRGRTSSSAVQIDHVVALGNVWQTGGQQLTEQQRTALANDPLELLAVDGPANASKGDGDAATWLPPNKSFRCQYIARQVAVKQRYHLWVTPPERDAMSRILQTCPDERLPVSGDADVQIPAPARD